MTRPRVRNVAFRFDDDTPFQWNRANPLFGFVGNILSFVAPPFENYLVVATRQAMSWITDSDVAAEADAFLRQEALHAREHRRHVAVLTSEDRLAPANELALGMRGMPARFMRGLWPRGRTAENQPPYPDQFATVPRLELLRMLYRLVRSQHPRHSPATEETPPFADEWLAEYDRGRNVVDWYGLSQA